ERRPPGRAAGDEKVADDRHDQIRAQPAAENAMTRDDEVHPEEGAALGDREPSRPRRHAPALGPPARPRARPTRARNRRPHVAATGGLARTSRKWERPSAKYRTWTGTFTIGTPSQTSRTTISGSKSMRLPKRCRSRTPSVFASGKHRKPHSGSWT